MNRKIFSRRLYVESLRQLRAPGIILTILYSLCGAVFPLNRIANYMLADSNRLSDFVCVDVGFSDMLPVTRATFFAVSVILVFCIFRFLNQRSASDFYHSLAFRREALFCSMFAAAMTWMLVILLIPVGLSLGIYLSYPALYSVQMGTVWRGIIGCAVLGFYTGGAAAAAMSLTGTFFSNAVATVVLLYLPRVFLGSVISSFGELTNYGECLTGSENLHHVEIWNDVYEWCNDVFRWNLLTDFYEEFQWKGILYTFCIGILFFVAALLLFRLRKSETAERSAMNRGIHIAIRSGLALLLFWLAIYLWQIGETVLLMFCAFVVVVYLAYELITVKKWKSVLKSTVWLIPIGAAIGLPALCAVILKAISPI